MKWSRLFQPRHPYFWIILALNALSMAMSWVAQNRPLNTLALVLVAVFAIGNATLSAWLAWRLMRGSPPESQARETSSAGQRSLDGG